MSTFSDYSVMPSTSGGGPKMRTTIARLNRSPITWGVIALLGIVALVFSAIVYKDLNKKGCGTTSVRGFSVAIITIISAISAFGLLRFGLLARNAYEAHEGGNAARSNTFATSASGAGSKF